MTTSKANRMSSEQYQQAIARLELSQLDAADLLGVDERTSRRWACNERDVPAPVARFLRYLLVTGKSGAYAIKKLERAK